VDSDVGVEQPEPRRRHPWQFGFSRLMLLTLAIAVALAFTRWWGIAGVVAFLVLAIPMWLRRRSTEAVLVLLKSLSAYGVASALTLPFLDRLWLGEIPLLALVQVPKVEFAQWLCRNVVMAAIQHLGLSRGSFSPDYILARPYALAIAYLIPLSVLLATVRVRTQMAAPYRVWSYVLIIVAFLDYGFTLIFAGGPGLSIY
jgi:hypothetical protein